MILYKDKLTVHIISLHLSQACDTLETYTKASLILIFLSENPPSQ